MPVDFIFGGMVIRSAGGDLHRHRDGAHQVVIRGNLTARVTRLMVRDQAARGLTSLSIPSAQSPLGYVQVVASLQIDPELRGCSKIPSQTEGRVRGYPTTAKHDVVHTRSGHLDGLRQRTPNMAESDRN